ncbi:hypothetical protein M9Y10_045170 [Tritrichomonas musculus]|uniref:Uncharacterized protein n=1 Tax=Tritrichomonas musculus TaxID=1915356 RepID=A0ABR2JVP9_9EUKA
MGCFSSCNKHSDFPDLDKRFSGIEINDKSDSSSDSTLKADIDKPSKDVTPLLEGNTLLAFKNLNLSSSSSIDLELNQIENMLKSQEDQKEKEKEQNTEVSDEGNDNRTFMGAATVQSDDEN